LLVDRFLLQKNQYLLHRAICNRPLLADEYRISNQWSVAGGYSGGQQHQQLLKCRDIDGN